MYIICLLDEHGHGLLLFHIYPNALSEALPTFFFAVEIQGVGSGLQVLISFRKFHVFIFTSAMITLSHFESVILELPLKSGLH